MYLRLWDLLVYQQVTHCLTVAEGDKLVHFLVSRADQKEALL